MAEYPTTIAPIEEPSSIIKQDGDRTVIIVEGQAGPRLPSSVVTGLIIFGASAFICPGIGLVAVILLPFVLLILGAIYLVSPQILRRPKNTQALVIAEDQIRLYEGCARTFELSDDDDQALEPAVIMGRDEVIKSAIRPADESEKVSAAIEIFDSSGARFEFAGGVVDSDEDLDGWAELEWLDGLLQGWLVESH
jgi:hypothetical protein